MSKTVLIAPLHWGLGHATRCIPIIRRQLAEGNKVVIAASDGPRSLLLTYFPDVEFVNLPFMPITYPRDGNMARHFFWRGPWLVWSIWQEHRVLQRLVSEKRIDLVISDSRFGLWSKKVKSIFITHQVRIMSPHFESVINRLNRWVMSKYDEVWIPDYESAPGLAGDLSHPINLPDNAQYIGPLSRLEAANLPTSTTKTWDVVAIISGPEPQRTMFETKVSKTCKTEGKTALIIRGKPEEGHRFEDGTVTFVSHLGDQAFLEALAGAKKIIARSGYSTIMDLNALGLKAEFHPTPGQTEQEYLAGLHDQASSE